MIFMSANYPPRLTPTGKNIHIRVFLSSDSTFSITTHMYREVEDSRSGEVGVVVGVDLVTSVFEIPFPTPLSPTR